MEEIDVKQDIYSLASDAQTFQIKVQEGDIVILGTDGGWILLDY